MQSHYFKVLFTKEKDDLSEAYIMPNESIDLDTPFDDFRTTIAKVREGCKARFF